MMITYLANFTDKQYSFTKEIEKELLKNNNVKSFNDRDFKVEELIESIKKSDLFLFIHGGVYTDNNVNFNISLERLKQILMATKCKKVMWFPDKVWFLNDQMMETIVPMLDYAFLNDDTWVRRHKYPNTFTLRMGATNWGYKGKYRKEYDVDVAFIGTPYGFRKPFLDALRQNFGNKFKIFTDTFGNDFCDLCKSAKIIFNPVQPNDDFYWDNRIYETLSAEGFMAYPDLYGLKDEGFEKGVHFIGYKTWNDLLPLLKDYLSKEEERNTISKNGNEFVKKFSYEKRLQYLFNKINESKNI